ncbi:MAG TPA: hypothetical protein VFO86_01140 [Terriglobia bacterium]|nr:hypothetical protein [Terriglobia bacterium]
MANKKKTKKKTSTLKKTTARKPASGKAAFKKSVAKKKTATKKPVRKKVVARKKVAPKKSVKTAARKSKPRKIPARPKPQGLNSPEIERGLVRARASVLSGDLQGLSRKPKADSESVDELVQEGNAYEAGILQGVEEADNADEVEVISHEELADDVPGEYLDKD